LAVLSLLKKYIIQLFCLFKSVFIIGITVFICSLVQNG
jgi:hypothetical protein